MSAKGVNQAIQGGEGVEIPPGKERGSKPVISPPGGEGEEIGLRRLDSIDVAILGEKLRDPTATDVALAKRFKIDRETVRMRQRTPEFIRALKQEMLPKEDKAEHLVQMAFRQAPALLRDPDPRVRAIILRMILRQFFPERIKGDLVVGGEWEKFAERMESIPAVGKEQESKPARRARRKK